MMNFKGWAIYADGDMVCLEDIKKLWDQRDNKFAVQVVNTTIRQRLKINILAIKMKIIKKKLVKLDFMEL